MWNTSFLLGLAVRWLMKLCGGGFLIEIKGKWKIGKKRPRTVKLVLCTSSGTEIMTENVIMVVGIAEIIFMKYIQEDTVLGTFGSGTHSQNGTAFDSMICTENSAEHTIPLNSQDKKSQNCKSIYEIEKINLLSA